MAIRSVGLGIHEHRRVDASSSSTRPTDLLKARYDTLFQGFKLKAAAGTLAESDVLAVNGLLAYGK